jgi:hypothetical protein
LVKKTGLHQPLVKSGEHADCTACGLQLSPGPGNPSALPAEPLLLFRGRMSTAVVRNSIILAWNTLENVCVSRQDHHLSASSCLESILEEYRWEKYTEGPRGGNCLFRIAKTKKKSLVRPEGDLSYTAVLLSISW